MSANDDDSGKATAAAAAASPSTTSFNNNFFPESRPPSTITSSVHKKFNLVEAIVSHQAQAYGHAAELGLIDRIFSWAFEIMIFVLLIVLIRKFVKQVGQSSSGEKLSTPPKTTSTVKDPKNVLGSKVAKDQVPKCILDNPSGAGETSADKRDSLRFKSKDLKYVKKRKWVSTDPIMMAHGRDLSLSPDKKWLNLRTSNTNNNVLTVDNNAMLNPLPLLRAQKKLDIEQEPPVQLEPPPHETVMEVKLQIPVSVTIVENIYNFKNFNVCFELNGFVMYCRSQSTDPVPDPSSCRQVHRQGITMG